MSPNAYVFTYAGLRDLEQTLLWLLAYRENSHVMAQLRDSAFDFVRSDPHFQEIYRTIPFSQ